MADDAAALIALDWGSTSLRAFLMDAAGHFLAERTSDDGASRLAGEIINHAMLVCGILGYKNDTPFSIGRHMRDVLSAPIMISNDRIFGNMSNLLLIHRLDPHLAS